MPHVLVDSRGQIEDPRGLLEKLRRRELEAILMNEGVSVPQDIPAEAARQVIRSSNIDISRYLDEQLNFLWPSSYESRQELELMRMTEIRALAARLGISFKPSTKKMEIVNAVKAYYNGEPAERGE